MVCLTDSISATWNFVHSAHREPLLKAIADPTNDFDREMLDYFFSQKGHRGNGVAELARLALTVQDGAL